MDTYEVKLDAIANVQVGYQTRGRIEEDLDGEFIIIRSQDCDENGDLLFEEAMHFTPSINPEKYFVFSGDILVLARGQTHLACLIEEQIENAVVSNSFYIVRIQDKNKILSAYLAWWINQPVVQAYFLQEQGLSTVPFISKTGLSQTPVIVPPLEIQEKVCNLIALWQKEQELLQQLTQKKENLVQAVARKAVLHSLEDKKWQIEN